MVVDQRYAGSRLMMMGMLCVLTSCYGQTLKLSDITAIQPTKGASMDELDGHWYVSRVFGGADTQYYFYTFDFVPTVAGLALFSNANSTSGSTCDYTVVELNATTDSYIFSTDTESSLTLVVAAADNGASHVLVFTCSGHGLQANSPCGSWRAMLATRTPGSQAWAAADVWLSSLPTPPGVNVSSGDAVQQDEECPLKPIWKLPGRDCVVADFPVQNNFNLTKYVSSPWLEMTWLSPSFMDPSTFYQDYVHRYTAKPDGTVFVNVTARDPQKPGDAGCMFYNLTLTTTAVPGKLTLLDPYKGPVPYNVITTDYENYAVVFGCYDLTSSGECEMARGWLWSRDVTLQRQFRRKANSLIMDLCVNPAAWFTTNHNNPCHKYTTDDSGRMDATAALVGFATILSVFLAHNLALWC